MFEVIWNFLTLNVFFSMIDAYVSLGIILATLALWMVNIHDKETESPMTFQQWAYMVVLWPKVVWQTFIAYDVDDGD